MLAIPTGRYSVLRGTPTTDEYGDEVDVQEVHLSGVAGSVMETRRTVFDPQSSRVVTLRQYTGRFNHGTDIQDGDRIKDEKTGVTFLVDAVTFSTSVVNSPDLILELSTN